MFTLFQNLEVKNKQSLLVKERFKKRMKKKERKKGEK